MTIGAVAFVTNDGKSEGVELHERLRGLLAGRGIDVDPSSPDLVLSIGGDGTMLRAAKTAHAADAPLLGINMGRLGYLTEVEAHDAEDALARVVAGDHFIEPRLMLSCRTENGTVGSVALNEVLLERPTGRLINLQVSVDDEPLAGFDADGVMVATPSGSTAYALSAGGPIVSPRADCLIVVPVNAHRLFTRPFVLAGDETVAIRLGEGETEATLVIDGAIEGDVTLGSTIHVERHPRPLKLVRLSGPGFVARLRTKLGLPG